MCTFRYKHFSLSPSQLSTSYRTPFWEKKYPLFNFL